MIARAQPLQCVCAAARLAGVRWVPARRCGRAVICRDLRARRVCHARHHKACRPPPHLVVYVGVRAEVVGKVLAIRRAAIQPADARHACWVAGRRGSNCDHAACGGCRPPGSCCRGSCRWLAGLEPMVRRSGVPCRLRRRVACTDTRRVSGDRQRVLAAVRACAATCVL
jgi:hypothetical protein